MRKEAHRTVKTRIDFDYDLLLLRDTTINGVCTRVILRFEALRWEEGEHSEPQKRQFSISLQRCKSIKVDVDEDESDIDDAMNFEETGTDIVDIQLGKNNYQAPFVIYTSAMLMEVEYEEFVLLA